MKQITFKDVKEVARGRWGSILATLVGGIMIDAIERGSARHSTCPIHGGEKPFRVFKDFETTGGCICSQCGGFNDGFSFLQELYAWTPLQALNEVAATLGIDSNTEREARPLPERSIVKKEVISAEEVIKRGDKINTIWGQGLSVQDNGSEPMIRYIFNRGLDIVKTPLTLKMVLAHSYYEENKFVANFSTMLAQVLDTNGECVAIHRTYLTFQGMKAPVEYPKKLYTKGVSLRGSAIRLFPAGETLGLCEGIETALAVNQKTGMPVWACVSANLLKQVVIPKTVKKVVIWADKDRSFAGQNAAKVLAERLYEEGFEVFIKLPQIEIPKTKKSLDWLDVHNANQRNDLRRTA